MTPYSTLCQHFICFTRIKTNSEVFTLKSISRIYLTNKRTYSYERYSSYKRGISLGKFICSLKGYIYLALLIYKCVLKGTNCKIILFCDPSDKPKRREFTEVRILIFCNWAKLVHLCIYIERTKENQTFQNVKKKLE